MSAPSANRPSPLEGGFSIVLGGPLYQALRRARLTDDALQLVKRRIVVISLIAWLPLFVLSAVDGVAFGSKVAVPFLLDVETQVRFLVALPLMVLAELVVHRRMRTVVASFVSLGIVQGPARERFDAAIESAMRLRNSIVAELLLIVAVYVVGRHWVWDQYVALDQPTWYGTPEGSAMRPGLAGHWYFAVSLPFFQFIMYRWFFRIFIWARFLWQVSRSELAYAPMHPDQLGGIGFLTRVTHAFTPLLLAQGALLSGSLANKIFYEGAKLTDFNLLIFFFVCIAVAVVLGPLLVFVLPLTRAKHAGLGTYGHLAKQYVDEFEEKWVAGKSSERLLGSADVQSLADMAGSFEVVRGMRVLPISRDAVVHLVVATLLPVAPLLLTMISVEDMVTHLVRIVF
jgi:hypothetical protein